MFRYVFTVNKFAKCFHVTCVVDTNDTDLGEIVAAIMLFVEVISGVVSVASVVCGNKQEPILGGECKSHIRYVPDYAHIRAFICWLDTERFDSYPPIKTFIQKQWNDMRKCFKYSQINFIIWLWCVDI